MMTRQDYVQIAAILTETRAWAQGRVFTQPTVASLSGTGSAGVQPTIDHITRELADLMAASNPRFNRATFCAAAGMTPPTGRRGGSMRLPRPPGRGLSGIDGGR